jgi:RNA polymerase sigma factor for flagellar operon FliA
MEIADRNALVEAHLDLARSIALRIARRLPPSILIDDLYQEACIGLMNAAERYENRHEEGFSGPVPFTSYAAVRVRGAVLDSVRRRHYLNATMQSLDSGNGDGMRMNSQEARDLSEAITYEPDYDAEIDGERRAVPVRQAIEELPEREQKVIQMSFREGLSGRAIGKRIGVSESRARQIRTAGLAKVKRVIAMDLPIAA